MQKHQRACLIVIVLLAFYGLQTACKFNPDYQERGEAALQGEWQQDTSALQRQLVSCTLYRFKFSCDSFFVSMHSYTKANTGADTCIKNGHWAEFAKGVYRQQHDTLTLKGLFCNANFSYKNEGGCFRSGNYEEVFKLANKSDSLLQFAPLSAVTPFTTHLIKRNSCIPKPL